MIDLSSITLRFNYSIKIKQLYDNTKFIFDVYVQTMTGLVSMFRACQFARGVRIDIEAPDLDPGDGGCVRIKKGNQFGSLNVILSMTAL